MKEYLSQVPDDVKQLILDLAASIGINENDYCNTELIGFVQGAVAMYHFQQKGIIELKKKIAALEVEVDLLEGEAK